ncbi:MAG TPA: metallophosphoesterase family protein [Arsenicitalea sp.]|nr:metallophosphoesterase family protein [Arsenicitalea sp.]
MRLAVISDVHGNRGALEAVVGDIAAQGVDAILNLGDHFSGALDPKGTGEILLELGALSIRGNHDRELVERDRADMGQTDAHAFDQLSPQHFEWLRTMPATAVFEREVLLAHGIPTSDSIYWLEAEPKDGRMLAAGMEHIEANADGLAYPVLLCGHSHIAREVMLADGRLVINPGSVGFPSFRKGTHDPLAGTNARYALLDKRNGRWTATFRSVPYDHMAAASLARANGNAEWAMRLAEGWAR